MGCFLLPRVVLGPSLAPQSIGLSISHKGDVDVAVILGDSDRVQAPEIMERVPGGGRGHKRCCEDLTYMRHTCTHTTRHIHTCSTHHTCHMHTPSHTLCITHSPHTPY